MQRDSLGRYLAEGMLDWVAIAEKARLPLPKSDPRRLGELRKQGFTPEGIELVLAFADERGIRDLAAAVEAFEAEAELPEMMGGGIGDDGMRRRLVTVGTGGRATSVTHDVSDKQRREWNAFMESKLFEGDDELYVKLAVGTALAEVRGQPADE